MGLEGGLQKSGVHYESAPAFPVPELPLSERGTAQTDSIAFGSILYRLARGSIV